MSFHLAFRTTVVLITYVKEVMSGLSQMLSILNLSMHLDTKEMITSCMCEVLDPL